MVGPPGLEPGTTRSFSGNCMGALPCKAGILTRLDYGPLSSVLVLIVFKAYGICFRALSRSSIMSLMSSRPTDILSRFSVIPNFFLISSGITFEALTIG